MKLAIIGTGPGCRDVTLADVEGHDVCAINQAVNFAPRVDIFAFQDPTEYMLPGLARTDFREVWCAYGQVRHAKAAFPWARVYESGALQASKRLGSWVDREIPEGVAFPEGIEPPENLRVFVRYGFAIPTMAAALITAGMHGYSDVLVFGAPMRGSGSPARPNQGFKDAETADFADRWRRERQLFAQAVRLLKDGYGCRVQRMVLETVDSH